MVMDCVCGKMMQVQRPLYPKVTRPFSSEGFCWINVLETVVEAGYSKAETKRLLEAGAIKVDAWKVTEDNCHMQHYRRKAGVMELIDKGMCLYLGKHTVIEILPTHVPLYKRLFWRYRPTVERWLGR